MPIWIRQLTVSNLGPISDLSIDLGRFNLFFGCNESGKTFLAEFILSSIFHNATKKTWSLRELSARGRIVVSGLEDNDTFFMPSSRKKIEDYWTEEDTGLPLDMARLLVVKGGELALSPGKSGGIDRDVLKSTLSQDVKIEQILENISKNVQACTLVDGEIEGARRGEYKSREDLIKLMEKRKRLLERVNQEYTTGNIRDLEIRKEKIQSELNIQEQAKCYRAYQIYKEIQQLSQELDQLQEKELEDLRDKIIEYERHNNEIQSLGGKIEKQNQSLKNVRWLEEAVSSWESMSLGNAPKAKIALLIFGAVFMVFGMSLAFVNALFSSWVEKLSINVVLPILAVIFFFGGSTMAGFYIWNMHQWNKDILRSDEREATECEYKRLFNQPISSLTGLRTHLNQLRMIEAIKNDMLGRQKNIRGSIAVLEKEIQSAFFRFKGEEILQSKWNLTLQSLRKKRSITNKQFQDKRVELGSMSVKESEYQIESADEEYDPNSYTQLSTELNKADEALKEAKDKLDGLKQQVCKETGDDQSSSWSVLIEHLEKLIEETAADYKNTTAQILAGIGMTNVLKNVQEQVDEKINRDLKSPEVIDTLFRFTGHLNDLELESILVRDNLGIYPLGSISTGAREQVQLALRMGIASRVTGGTPMFMILDDAFQHSDWNRREKLIDTIIEMAKSGWQMIYLSMDDHIRSRMYDKGTIEFGKDFCFFEL